MHKNDPTRNTKNVYQCFEIASNWLVKRVCPDAQKMHINGKMRGESKWQKMKMILFVLAKL